MDSIRQLLDKLGHDSGEVDTDVRNALRELARSRGVSFIGDKTYCACGKPYPCAARAEGSRVSAVDRALQHYRVDGPPAPPPKPRITFDARPMPKSRPGFQKVLVPNGSDGLSLLEKPCST